MKIRTITPFLLAGALLAGAMASGTALAQHRFHGGPRVGVYIGAPMFPYYYSPFYYSPYYYAPPVFVAPAAPTVYIEQAQPQPAPAPQPQAAPQPLAPGWWYYCAEGQGYYPYIRQCPGGWQQVAPQPQGQP
ncbi:MAG: hypothetical protein NT176_10390 [Proteobacteria bacterium]|nr:hypothetical protein [Pseudomonadota bacterium]